MQEIEETETTNEEQPEQEEFETHNEEPVDESSIKRLVDTESIAAIYEDIDTLMLVYFPDATITDNGQIWHDPIEHYKWVFTSFDILNVSNSDVRIEFTSDNAAVVYRTAKGRVTNKATQETTSYTDDSGKLIFQKDTNGCWRIWRFDKAPNGYK